MTKPTATEGNATITIPTLGGRDVTCAGRDPWQVSADIAALQRNRISTAQLLAAGVSERMIVTARSHARLLRVLRGVYVLGPYTAVDLGRETAALLIGPQLTLVGLSVLSALALVPHDASEPVHVAGTARRRPGIVVHRYGELGRIRPVLGLPMTTVERALLDAADTLTGRPLERAVDEALAARKTSRTKIRETAQGARGRRGAAELLALADRHRPNSQTKGDYAERALQLIRAANLPEPDTEVSVLGFLVDFFFAEAGVVVEVDPHSIHGVIRANFNRDRAKARACRAAGLEYISVTGDDLLERPYAFISDLTQTITRRMAVRQAAA